MNCIRLYYINMNINFIIYTGIININYAGVNVEDANVEDI